MNYGSGRELFYALYRPESHIKVKDSVRTGEPDTSRTFAVHFISQRKDQPAESNRKGE